MAPSVPSVFATAIFALGFAALLPHATARPGGFLRSQSAVPVESPEILLDELEKALGEGHRLGAESRVQTLEEVMLPTFRALPKLPGDRLDMGSARYLLHRLFVSRHNWNVHAFAAAGDAWNSSSPAAVFREHGAGGHAAAAAFDRRFADGGRDDGAAKGVTLREAAMLAATLESLVNEELTGRLGTAFRVTGLSGETALKDRDVDLLMDAYMVLYLGRMNNSVTATEVQARLGRFRRNPYWEPTRKFLREVRREAVSALPEEAEKNSRASIQQQVESASYRYGRHADRECIDLKQDLMQHEGRTPGRVPLTDFYRAALHGGQWQFSESKDFLAQAGALDESDPKRPSVIIPNWIGLPSNCVAGSKFYSVCCINECDALLGEIEQRIAGQDAAPERIVEVVEQLPSSTVDVPRALSPTLVGRLRAVAAKHGGRVPLHGRLFAQWLHNAYPRECPYPHLTGAIKPMETAAYKAATGQAADLDKTSMARQLSELERLEDAPAAGAAAADGADDADACAFPAWSEEEELFTVAMRDALVDPARPSALRSAAPMLVALSMVGALVQMASSARSAASGGGGPGKKAGRRPSALAMFI